MITYRYLRGYTLDPGFSTSLDTVGFNLTVYKIIWEDLNKKKNLGPSGEYFEIIDIDPASNCVYEPVNLDSIEVLAEQGLSPSVGNPQFHQQFVYTIAMKTIEYFEHALGRKLLWQIREIKNEIGNIIDEQYVPQLRIYPHAFRGANAYYDREKKAILFGYFKASNKKILKNFPREAIFSCLSPDIIAHELTHAILDSIHPRFIENTNLDVPAFHEAFADIIALLQRFTNPELVINQLTKTGGSLEEFNYLGELATQFGNSLENSRGALRGAIGEINKKGKWERREPDIFAYQNKIEPHERGSLLVATFFDALIKVYKFKVQDLIGIATNGSDILPQGTIQYDLAKRLAFEVGEIAKHLMYVAIRALDYCPPVDITFGEYLRALITADLEYAPTDENNYRIALIDAFRSWAILPDRINTFSEESLKWNNADLNVIQKKAFKRIANFLRTRVWKISNLKDRKKIYDLSREIQRGLHHYLFHNAKPIIKPSDNSRICLSKEEIKSLIPLLGLASDKFSFKDDTGHEFTHREDEMKFEIHKVRPAYRVGKEGLILEQIIVTITQSLTFNLIQNFNNSKKENSENMKFRGGCTIIFNLANDLNVSYLIRKNIQSKRRFLEQWSYNKYQDSEALSVANTYLNEGDSLFNIDFGNLHFI